jgi:hypothetical protein
MWMAGDEQLAEWNRCKRDRGDAGEGCFEVGHGIDREQAFVMQESQQRVVPTCTRGFAGGICDAMMHISAIAADALCRAGYADHPRLKDYAHSMTQLAAMFGYFCSCWGILEYGRELDDRGDSEPDFNRPERQEEHDDALEAVPYGYGRDAQDLLYLANCPQAAGIHRPDLADTNGWSPYTWRDMWAPTGRTPTAGPGPTAPSPSSQAARDH